MTRDLWSERINILNSVGVGMPARAELAGLDVDPAVLRVAARQAYAEGKRGDQIVEAVRSMIDDRAATPADADSPVGEVATVPAIEGPAGEPLAETNAAAKDDRSANPKTKPKPARKAKRKPAAGRKAEDQQTMSAKPQAASLKLVAPDGSTTTVQEPAGKPDRQPAKSLPEVIDADLAARHFRVTLRTWRRWDSAGRIPLGFKIGGRKLWRATDLESWANWGFPKRDDFVARVRVEAEGP